MIFTLFITCVFGLGAMQPEVAAPRSNETQVVESKVRHNIVGNNSYSVTSYTSILDVDVVNWLLFDYPSAINYLTPQAVGFTYTFNSPEQLSSLKVVPYNYCVITNSNSDFGFSNGKVVHYFNFRCRQYNSGQNNLFWMDYTFDLLANSYAVSIDFTIFCSSYGGNRPLWIDISSWEHNTGQPYCVVMKNSSFLYGAFSTDGSFSYDSYQSGYLTGYSEGYDNGYDYGEMIGFENGKNHYYEIGYDEGEQAGYQSGYSDASADSGVPATIFSGILSVALIPVNVFIQMFQYEVFGINIAGLVSALITIAMVIIIVRFLLGGKNDGK